MIETEFKPEQFEAIYPSGIERHYWTLARNLIIKKELEKNGLKDKRLLEVGCGRGLVVDFLRQAGFDCYGVELAAVESIPRVEEYIFPKKDISNLDSYFSNSIDVILLLDVLEHIADDSDFLRRIQVIFPQAKCLVVTVPARGELWSNYDSFNGHFRRYDLDSLNLSVEKTNWRVASSRYFFHTLYWPARLLLHFLKKRQTGIFPPTGLMIGVHKMLAYLFLREYAFLPKHWRGTSIVSTLILAKENN